MKILRIKNLNVSYFRDGKSFPAVADASLSIDAGSNHAIVGESGSGKSTLALALLRLIMPYEGSINSGEIIFEEGDILKYSTSRLQKLRGREISIVFQDPFSTLNPVMKVGAQLSEAILAHKKLNRGDVEKLSNKLLRDVMLEDSSRILASYPHELSGGQKQRIALAMAIAHKPKVLLADEPTTALDVTIAKEIMELIEKLKHEYNLTVIFITHNLALAFERSDYITVMLSGEILESAPKNDILKKPLHPYTKELLNSIRGKASKILPPNASSNLSAALCPFLSRCSKALEICRKVKPALIKIGNSKVKCHNNK